MSDQGLEIAPSVAQGRLDRLFGLSARGTSVRREILAGITTFAALSYILAVNPAIMAAAGMDRVALVMGTAIASIAGCILVAVMANLPLAMAPAMGANIVFVYTVVQAAHVPWRAALAMVLLSGFVFLLLSLSRLRARIAREVPEAIKVGMQASVGALIVVIALRGAGVVTADHNTLTTLGRLSDPPVLLTLFGILATAFLMLREVPAALILSIVGITAIGLFVPAAGGGTLTPWPERLVAWPVWPSATFAQLDPLWLLHHLPVVLPLFFYFLCSEFFSTLSTLIGTTGAAGLIRKDGTIPSATGAFAADAIGTMVGPLFGTSTVCYYAESVTGVIAGGRTGLVSLVVAALFALSLFLWPLLIVIPPQATAPALVMVGVLMLQGTARIDMRDFGEALPVVVMLLLTAITNTLVVSMAIGTFCWILARLASGRGRDITPTIWGIGAVFVLYLVVSTRIA